MRAISLGYHDVLTEKTALDGLSRSSSRYALDVNSFRAHLHSIRQHTFESAVCLVDPFRMGEPEIPIFLTFDDGALGSYTCVADELEALGWKGHFFIVTDWIGKPGFVGRREIRELRDRGHIIGSHSRSHPARMSHLGREDLMREWSESCLVLSDILGEPVKVASVANGYYSDKVVKTAAEAGIEMLFNSEPTTFTSVVNGCLILGRYCIKAGMPPSVSGGIAAGWIWPRGRQAMMWKIMNAAKSITGESYFTIRTSLLSRSMPKT
jgi:peptidoglycan/xylan/chitin deacetylase (PgdA/CDA1 family)